MDMTFDWFAENTEPVDEEVYISAESLQKIMEKCTPLHEYRNDEGVTYEKAFDNFNRRYNIRANFKSRDMAETANRIFEMFGERGITSSTLNEMKMMISAHCTSVANEFRRTRSRYGSEMNDALELMLMFMVVGMIVSMVINLILGPFIGNLVCTCILAPWSEEICKAIAIRGGFGREWAIVFNATEFSQYVIIFGPSVGFVKMIIARTIVVLMHLSTMLIQWITTNPKVMAKLGWDKNKNTEEIKTAGLMTSVAIHTLWNVGATLISI